MAKKQDDENHRVVANNRKAYHDFHVLESYEAGISLKGSEIKSVREGSVSLRDGFVLVERGEMLLLEVDIARYDKSSRSTGHEPRRKRKLLMHRREIDSITGKVQRKGLTIIPLKIYLKNNIAKVEIGLVKSKKQFDRKQDIIKRDMQRDMHRDIKSFGKSDQ